MKISIAFLLVLAVSLFLTGCFPLQSYENRTDRPGFFTGIWHGWIAPISLVVSLFDSDVRIYQPNNSGWWYDFGFYIAVIAGFGGLEISRRRKNSYHRD